VHVCAALIQICLPQLGRSSDIDLLHMRDVMKVTWSLIKDAVDVTWSGVVRCDGGTRTSNRYYLVLAKRE